MNRGDHHITAPLDQRNPFENVVGCRVGEIIQSINTRPFDRRRPVRRDAARVSMRGEPTLSNRSTF
jgi:hypothetical protein